MLSVEIIRLGDEQWRIQWQCHSNSSRPAMSPWGSSCGNRVQRLAPLQPNFVSVTYGADGSTRARTHDCVLRILRETNLTVAPHLTCVGAPRAEVLRIAQDYWQQGVRHLVALRGDRAAANCGAGRALSAAPRRICLRVRPGGGTRGRREVRDFGGGLPGRASGIRQRRGGFGEPEAQDRCGRGPRHHAVLLRYRCVPALSRSLRGRRHSRAASCPASCRSRAFRSCCASPSAAARPCRRGCGSASTDWMTIPRRAA